MKRLLTLLTLSLLVLLVVPVQAQTTITDELLTEFEQLVVDEMDYYGIPGAAIAIIEGDEVVYAEGFGVRDLASGNPFTTETQFRIGSTTKSMTALLIAQWVEAGVLTWDTPVTELFPDFETADPELTAQLTVADLMGMGTGLVSNSLDGLTWGSWTIDDLLASIASMQIGGAYGEFYAYNNEVYALAGYAATVANGMDPTLENYAALLDTQVFEPIGMDSAIITDDVSELSENYSESYEYSLATGDTALMNNPPIALVAPAGGVWMHVEDMARYVITQMNGGVTPDGTRIVSEDALAETWQPGVATEFNIEGVENTAYAMGWVTQTYEGVPVRFHDGGWAGYSTQMLVLPEDDVALIVFANHTNGALFGSTLNYAFIELVHDLEPRAVETAHGMYDELAAQLEQAAQIISTEIGDVTSLTGTYEDGWMIEQDADGALWLDGQGWRFQIGTIPMMGDQYLILNNGAAGTFLTFEVDGDAVTLVLEVPGEAPWRLAKVG